MRGSVAREAAHKPSLTNCLREKGCIFLLYQVMVKKPLADGSPLTAIKDPD
ncbi:MAG: hypothetical protein KGJ06_08125 [Pseudomonadota bacterium]|nr:hypothetical protein [Pseudomonadota bacterium]